jgi:hypothetical protein
MSFFLTSSEPKGRFSPTQNKTQTHPEYFRVLESRHVEVVDRILFKRDFHLKNKRSDYTTPAFKADVLFQAVIQSFIFEYAKSVKDFSCASMKDFMERHELSCRVYIKGGSAANIFNAKEDTKSDLDSVIEFNKLPHDPSIPQANQQFFRSIAYETIQHLIRTHLKKEAPFLNPADFFENLILFSDNSLFLLSFGGIDFVFPIPKPFEKGDAKQGNCFLHESLRISIPVAGGKIQKQIEYIAESDFEIDLNFLERVFHERIVCIPKPEAVLYNGFERLCYTISKGWTILDEKALNILIQDLVFRTKALSITPCTTSTFMFTEQGLHRLYKLVQKKGAEPFFALNIFLNGYRLVNHLANKSCPASLFSQSLFKEAFLEKRWQQIFPAFVRENFSKNLDELLDFMQIFAHTGQKNFTSCVRAYLDTRNRVTGYEGKEFGYIFTPDTKIEDLLQIFENLLKKFGTSRVEKIFSWVFLSLEEFDLALKEKLQISYFFRLLHQVDYTPQERCDLEYLLPFVLNAFVKNPKLILHDGIHKKIAISIEQSVLFNQYSTSKKSFLIQILENPEFAPIFATMVAGNNLDEKFTLIRIFCEKSAAVMTYEQIQSLIEERSFDLTEEEFVITCIPFALVLKETFGLEFFLKHHKKILKSIHSEHEKQLEVELIQMIQHHLDIKGFFDEAKSVLQLLETCPFLDLVLPNLFSLLREKEESDSRITKQDLLGTIFDVINDPKIFEQITLDQITPLLYSFGDTSKVVDVVVTFLQHFPQESLEPTALKAFESLLERLEKKDLFHLTQSVFTLKKPLKIDLLKKIFDFPYTNNIWVNEKKELKKILLKAKSEQNFPDAICIELFKIFANSRQELADADIKICLYFIKNIDDFTEQTEDILSNFILLNCEKLIKIQGSGTPNEIQTIQFLCAKTLQMQRPNITKMAAPWLQFAQSQIICDLDIDGLVDLHDKTLDAKQVEEKIIASLVANKEPINASTVTNICKKFSKHSTILKTLLSNLEQLQQIELTNPIFEKFFENSSDIVRIKILKKYTQLQPFGKLSREFLDQLCHIEKLKKFSKDDIELLIISILEIKNPLLIDQLFRSFFEYNTIIDPSLKRSFVIYKALPSILQKTHLMSVIESFHRLSKEDQDYFLQDVYLEEGKNLQTLAVESDVYLEYVVRLLEKNSIFNLKQHPATFIDYLQKCCWMTQSTATSSRFVCASKIIDFFKSSGQLFDQKFIHSLLQFDPPKNLILLLQQSYFNKVESSDSELLRDFIRSRIKLPSLFKDAEDRKNLEKIVLNYINIEELEKAFIFTTLEIPQTFFDVDLLTRMLLNLLNRSFKTKQMNLAAQIIEVLKTKNVRKISAKTKLELSCSMDMFVSQLDVDSDFVKFQENLFYFIPIMGANPHTSQVVLKCFIQVLDNTPKHRLNLDHFRAMLNAFLSMESIDEPGKKIVELNADDFKQIAGKLLRIIPAMTLVEINILQKKFSVINHELAKVLSVEIMENYPEYFLFDPNTITTEQAVSLTSFLTTYPLFDKMNPEFKEAIFEIIGQVQKKLFSAADLSSFEIHGLSQFVVFITRAYQKEFADLVNEHFLETLAILSDKQHIPKFKESSTFFVVQVLTGITAEHRKDLFKSKFTPQFKKIFSNLFEFFIDERLGTYDIKDEDGEFVTSHQYTNRYKTACVAVTQLMSPLFESGIDVSFIILSMFKALRVIDITGSSHEQLFSKTFVNFFITYLKQLPEDFKIDVDFFSNRQTVLLPDHLHNTAIFEMNFVIKLLAELVFKLSKFDSIQSLKILAKIPELGFILQRIGIIFESTQEDLTGQLMVKSFSIVLQKAFSEADKIPENWFKLSPFYSVLLSKFIKERPYEGMTSLVLANNQKKMLMLAVQNAYIRADFLTSNHAYIFHHIELKDVIWLLYPFNFLSEFTLSGFEDNFTELRIFLGVLQKNHESAHVKLAEEDLLEIYKFTNACYKAIFRKYFEIRTLQKTSIRHLIIETFFLLNKYIPLKNMECVFDQFQELLFQESFMKDPKIDLFKKTFMMLASRELPSKSRSIIFMIHKIPKSATFKELPEFKTLESTHADPPSKCAVV